MAWLEDSVQAQLAVNGWTAMMCQSCYDVNTICEVERGFWFCKTCSTPPANLIEDPQRPNVTLVGVPRQLAVTDGKTPQSIDIKLLIPKAIVDAAIAQREREQAAREKQRREKATEEAVRHRLDAEARRKAVVVVRRQRAALRTERLPAISKKAKPKIAPFDVVQSYLCDLCHASRELDKMRAYRFEGIYKGMYCTDCYYTKVTRRGEPSESYRRIGRRKIMPNLSQLEYDGIEALVIRNTEHRDLRRDFPGLGSNFESYVRAYASRTYRDFLS